MEASATPYSLLDGVCSTDEMYMVSVGALSSFVASSYPEELDNAR